MLSFLVHKIFTLHKGFTKTVMSSSRVEGLIDPNNTGTATLYCPTDAHNVKKHTVIKTF